MTPINDRIEVYADGSGKWRWRRLSANGEPIAYGESHRDATDAERAARRACPDVTRFVIEKGTS